VPHRPIIVALVLALAVAAGVQAASVRDLYVATVPLEARTPDPSPEALRAALAAVLVKLSGRRDVVFEPRAIELLGDASRYVQQTGFTATGELRVGFEPAALREYMLGTGLPLWGDDRPAVLLWLAVDVTGTERTIIGADDELGVQGALLELAGERGLPLQLPLLDAEDLARLQFGDVWGGFDEALLEASARYGVDAVLIGRATGPALDQLAVDWRLLHAGDVEEWQGSLVDGVEHTADVLASRYASVSAGAAQAMPVSVDGIDSGQAYGRVLAYLRGLTVVSDVRVERVAGERVEFTLTTMAEPDKLARQLELSGFLTSARAGALDYAYVP
jgi:uncharacterized protein